MLVDRKNQSQSLTFDRLAQVFQVDNVYLHTIEQNLRMYVTKEMKYMRGKSSFKEDVITKILKMADGN